MLGWHMILVDLLTYLPESYVNITKPTNTHKYVQE